MYCIELCDKRQEDTFDEIICTEGKFSLFTSFLLITLFHCFIYTLEVRSHC